jgi:hypothetical protein
MWLMMGRRKESETRAVIFAGSSLPITIWAGVDSACFLLLDLAATESRGYPLCAPSRLPTTPFTAHYDVKPRVISDPAIQPANSESELDANKKAA